MSQINIQYERFFRHTMSKENKGKKFHICLMNPPYDRNLHLKFLRKTISNAKKIINISPVRWLQDPFHGEKRSTLKQYEDVARHIDSIEVLKNDKLFDISIFSDLGIYVLNENVTHFDYNNYWRTIKTEEDISLIEKISNNKTVKHLNDVVERNKKDGIRVMICDISGNRGTSPIYKDIVYTIDGKVNGKDWTECKNMGGYVKEKGSPLPNSIKFSTEQEAENFWHSYNDLKLLDVICDLTVQQQSIQLSKLPFLDDYTHKITDAELYDIFGLNHKEIEYVENFETFRKKRRKKQCQKRTKERNSTSV